MALPLKLIWNPVNKVDQLLASQKAQLFSTPSHLWHKHFRVSRDTYENISGLVGPQLARQNTIHRAAITIEKRVAVALWRLW